MTGYKYVLPIELDSEVELIYSSNFFLQNNNYTLLLNFYIFNALPKHNFKIQDAKLLEFSYSTLSSPPLSSPPCEFGRILDFVNFNKVFYLKKLYLRTYCELDLPIFSI